MNPSRKALVVAILIFTAVVTDGDRCFGQHSGMFAPYTQWYQDPLGVKPLELSTAPGFIWGSAGIAACLLFVKDDPAFRKRLAIYQDSWLGFGYKPPYTTAFQTEAGVMISMKRWMSVGLGWDAIHFSDRLDDVWTFGFRPFARWYPYRGRTFLLFAEYGAGVSLSLHRFPLTGPEWGTDTGRTGTKFNFITKYGVGVEIRCNSRLTLQAGGRHFHLSNGNLAGLMRNPTHDSNGFLLGMTYAFE